MMGSKINWFGVAAGIVIFVLLVVSFYIPWWQLTIGQDLVLVNASPVNTNFGLLGLQFTVPLLWALNIASVLLLVASGTIMLLYSFLPSKSYSKELLGFSYKKPLLVLIAFLASLIATLAIASAAGFSIPFTGSNNISLPTEILSPGVIANIRISTGFQLPFWLAICAATLSIIARLYHARVAQPPITTPTPVTST